VDIDDLRYAVTVLSFLAFVGIVAWAWSSRNKRAFAEAQNLPFIDSGVPE
jgi:cytochrome c oxidase cbb3-type subunit IV